MVESLKYDLNTIQLATNNFSLDNKIGEGGFGAVYKVSLKDNLVLSFRYYIILGFSPFYLVFLQSISHTCFVS